MDDERLAMIRLVYGGCDEGTLGHSAAQLATEVTELRAQLARMERLDACSCGEAHRPGCHKAAL